MQRTQPSVSAPSGETTVRLLEAYEDLERAAEVIGAVWDDPTLASPSLLRAYTHFGNPTLGAFDGARLVGVSVGFLAPSGGVHLHSHITGVLPDSQLAGVGHLLKLAQRDWCLDNGVREITWTFDPMLARNAHFNLHKLGAVAEAVLPGFYGEMRDAINRGDVTDRLETHWYLDAGDEPARGPIERRVAIPRDYQSLRAEDPTQAMAERLRVRAELVDGFDAGLYLVDFVDGAYAFAAARTCDA